VRRRHRKGQYAKKNIQDGWRVQFRNQEGCHEETFCYVVIATGQYIQKHRPTFPGEVDFTGKVVTDLVKTKLLLVD